jgi:acetyl-CoA carboxylase biotin carboxyl carrier protein
MGYVGASDLPIGELLNDFTPSLLKVFDASTLTELDIRVGDLRIRLRRGGADGVVAGAPMAGAVAPAAALPDEEQLEGHVVTAQMVGTFYLTPAPNKPPLVQEGDVIEKGQVIGIIEAMKVMNELEADVGGKVARIMVQNQQPVEYGQPLMVIVPE